MSQFPKMPQIPSMPQHQEIGYGQNYYRGRPGILTAVGVLSIIIGGISALTSAGGAFAAMGFLMLSSMPPATMTLPTTTTSSSVKVTGGLLVTPEEDGFDEEIIEVVVGEMDPAEAFSDERRLQLETLLEQAGNRVFPMPAGAEIDATFIRSNITRRGTIPAAGGAEAGNFFTVGTGRVEVYDDHAVFRPTGSADVISVSVPADSVENNFEIHSSSAGAAGGAGATTMPVPMPKVSAKAAGLLMAVQGISALLAIFLVIAGILVLRDVRAGGRMHWMYVFIKLPLIAISAAAWIWVMQSVMQSMSAAIAAASPQATPPPGGVAAMIVPTLMSVAIAGAYPIGLVFVLLSKPVREFYSGVEQ